MIEWSNASFEIDQIPPSKNENKWKGTAGRMATKKKWRQIFQGELLKLILPMPLPIHPDTPLICMVTLRFTSQSRNPETRNYVPAIEECLADALRRSEDSKAARWIEDDKDDQVRISIHQMDRRGPRGMRVELRWMEVEEESEDMPFFESDGPVAQLPS
jgi:hypothetical protein